MTRVSDSAVFWLACSQLKKQKDCQQDEEDREVGKDHQQIQAEETAHIASGQLEEECKIARCVSIAGIVFHFILAVQKVEQIKFLFLFDGLFFQIVQSRTLVVFTQFLYLLGCNTAVIDSQ